MQPLLQTFCLLKDIIYYIAQTKLKNDHEKNETLADGVAMYYS